MAQRGRPRSKPVKKWNPRYSKMAVRAAIQNAFMKNPDVSMMVNTHGFTKQILEQCDEWALKDGQSPPE
tara:strand:+ start:236 stop:442 length:207 start_codon:yes stop_codon:yes gene_type:complete